jgi:hypothetical protein
MPALLSFSPCPCGEKHILPVYPELFDDKLQFAGTFGEGCFAFTNLAKRATPRSPPA